MITEHDRGRIHKIVGGEGTWFNAHLIRLINKADEHNKELLAKVYPEVVEAYDDWFYSKGPYEGKEGYDP